jgi:hypothetical protein
MINIKHGNNPEAELFLCDDGVIFLSCVDVSNRHMGGGWSILGSEVWSQTLLEYIPLPLSLFLPLSISISLFLFLSLYLSHKHKPTILPCLEHPHKATSHPSLEQQEPSTPQHTFSI